MTKSRRLPLPSSLFRLLEELEVWFLSNVRCPAPMSQYAISSKWLPKMFIQIFKEHLRAKLQAPVVTVLFKEKLINLGYLQSVQEICLSCQHWRWVSYRCTRSIITVMEKTDDIYFEKFYDNLLKINRLSAEKTRILSLIRCGCG